MGSYPNRTNNGTIWASKKQISSLSTANSQVDHATIELEVNIKLLITNDELTQFDIVRCIVCCSNRYVFCIILNKYTKVFNVTSLSPYIDLLK